MTLTSDEFRLIAYLRGYADGWGDGYHLDPNYVADQLGFDIPRMRTASKGLERAGLVTLFEFEGSPKETMFYPDPSGGPVQNDICMTQRGWGYLCEPNGVG